MVQRRVAAVLLCGTIGSVACGRVAPQMVTYGPSPDAVALQLSINAAIRSGGAPTVLVKPGDYFFGNASLLIQSASNLTLQAENGPGSVQLWFSIGSGILVNQSSDVTLDGLSVDYDPPAHFQGTVVGITDDGSSSEIQAVVKTDPGFLDPATFDAQYREGMPGVQTGPAALVWNSSDPGFGAYAGAAWPPASAADGVHHVFNLSRAEFCTGIQFTTTDGTSCLDAAADTQARKSLDASNHKLQLQDKITAHIRIGYTLHLLNSSHVHTQHTSIHGAPGFAITEYDGYGKHSYHNVSLGRRHRTANQRRAANSSMHANDAAMCGVANPTGGRLCLGLIASNNDALHSSGCKHGPSFVSGELSYCMDDWVNIHSRTQVVLERVDARHLIMIDPRLDYAVSVPDNFPYGNVETMPNANPMDQISFYLSGTLGGLGSARVLSATRATWDHDASIVAQAQSLLDTKFNRTCGLDAGMHCREFGCRPRVWYVTFDSDVPAWTESDRAKGVVASLDSWTGSGAVIKDSHLHHGRFGIRWKSSNGVISGNRISARYVEISPLEYYMEGPFRLQNITVVDNTFSGCAAPPASYAPTPCATEPHLLPLGYWTKWTSWGGGTGGICKAAAVGATELVQEACADISVADNVKYY